VGPGPARLYGAPQRAASAGPGAPLRGVVETVRLALGREPLRAIVKAKGYRE